MEVGSIDKPPSRYFRANDYSRLAADAMKDVFLLLPSIVLIRQSIDLTLVIKKKKKHNLNVCMHTLWLSIVGVG